MKYPVNAKATAVTPAAAISRRNFLHRAATTAAAVSIIPAHVLKGADSVSPNSERRQTVKAYETLVVGGGLSGLSCAIALAKAGNKVLLLESRSSLAWECTRAYELALSNTTTVMGELIRSRLTEVGGFDGQLADATILEMLVYRLCREYKIEVLLYTSPIHVHIEKSRVQGLWLGGKGSMRYVQAEWFIDATEDAVLWKQTQTAWKSVDVPARFRTYFNHLENPIGSTIQLDSKLRICPTLWKSEACLELTLPSANYLGAWRELVRALPGVRTQIASLQPGVISNTALEVFPLAPSVEVEVLGQRHPKLSNLIGAGVWCGGTEVGIDKRMQWGEGAARLILGEKPMKNAKRLIADPPSLDWALLGADQVQYDVTIIGGGTGGVMAALASAREGARTLLVEQGPVLGGMTTGGGIHEPVRGREGKLVEELFALHNQLLPLFGGSQWKPYRPKRNHPEAMKASLMQLLSEAGIEVMYGTSMVSSVVVPGDDSGTRIAEVLVATPKGLKRIKSSTYVDSTGDGDLARASGASFRFGRDRDGRPHAYTLPGPFFQEDYLRWYNNDNGFVDPTDLEDLSEERMRGVEQFWTERFSDQNRILHVLPLLGVRQSVQIEGDYTLSFREEVLPRTFTDSVATVIARLGSHGRDFESESHDLALWVWGFGFYDIFFEFDIPFRCLLPKGLNNLLLGSRCISVSYDAFGPIRMQPTIMQVGETAGRAAAMATKTEGNVRRIDVEALRKQLKGSDVLSVPKRTLIGKIPESIERVNLDSLKNAVWHCDLCPTELFLDTLAKDSDPHVRFLCGIALSKLGDLKGDEVLLDLIRTRCPVVPQGVATIPIWQAAIRFIRTLPDVKSIDTMLPLLAEGQDLSVRVSAIQLLGRSGFPEAIETLRQLLESLNSTDKLVNRKLRRYDTTGVMQIFKEPDVEETWALKLNLSRSLIELGAADDLVLSVVKETLEDHRSVVRRFANIVMDAYNEKENPS